MYDYFYGPQADQFSFIRIPTVLFSKEDFKNISTDAKVLYGILLKRMDLSAKNGWLDKLGRVYIICTLDEIMETLNCGKQKAVKLREELESKGGLIERKRQGQGKPNLIYVKNFIRDVDKSVDKPVEKQPASHFRKFENHTSGNVKTTRQEVRKSHGSNTDNNDTDMSYTENPILSGWDGDGISERLRYQVYFRDQLELDHLLEQYPYERDTLMEIFDLVVDTVCSKREYIRIAGDDKPKEVVKGRFMKLNSLHIGYVMDCMKENAADVRNIKQYLLAALYNAPGTISSYYQAKVNHNSGRKHKAFTLNDYRYEEGESF